MATEGASLTKTKTLAKDFKDVFFDGDVQEGLAMN